MAVSSSVMMAGTTAANSYSQSEAQKAQGDYQKQQSYLNASLADRQAQDAIERGRTEAGASKRRTNDMVASQKTAAAAQGLDVSTGSPQETMASTEALGAVETMNIKTNAWREAWGFKSQAINDRTSGDMAEISAAGAAKQTLIAGGMQAAGYGAQGVNAYQKRGQTPSVTSRTKTYAGGRSRLSGDEF
jgi:hypothetical protein